MGKHNNEFSGPANNNQNKILRLLIEIKTEGKTFIGRSQNSIIIDLRYWYIHRNLSSSKSRRIIELPTFNK